MSFELAKIVLDPDWNPYCGRCSTMGRMARLEDRTGYQCSCCKNVIYNSMVRKRPLDAFFDSEGNELPAPPQYWYCPMKHEDPTTHSDLDMRYAQMGTIRITEGDVVETHPIVIFSQLVKLSEVEA